MENNLADAGFVPEECVCVMVAQFGKSFSSECFLKENTHVLKQFRVCKSAKIGNERIAIADLYRRGGKGDSNRQI